MRAAKPRSLGRAAMRAAKPRSLEEDFLYRGLLLMQRFQKKWDFNLGIFDLVVCYGFVLFVSLSLVYLFSALFCPICISSLFLGFESVVFFISSLTSFCFILIFSRVECILCVYI